MRSTTICILLLIICSCGQGELADRLENDKQKIEDTILVDKDKLDVLVQITGQPKLQIVVDQKWPDNIVTTYNILKDKNGNIIYVGEFPTCESGDWNLKFAHFFDSSGLLIAFEEELKFFNEPCSADIVIFTDREIYDSAFKVNKHSTTVTDKEGNKLEDECGQAYDFKTGRFKNVKDLIRSKGIGV